MEWMLAILGLVPASAACWIWRIRHPHTREWLRVHLPVLLALVAIGLAAAWPFLTSLAVGSGEAYNYSLALADAVQQLRAGHLPLVGQTEYAFNGRVHPLRNAPYLFYLGGVLDTLSFRQLTTWQLQNLSLAFSLLFASFATYFALRRSTPASRPLALLLSAAFVLSPSVLGLAHVVNMFMTVHALPFAALAVGAALRQLLGWELKNDLCLAIALGGAWLAHPPLALWLTVALVLIRGAVFACRFNWRSIPGLLYAAGLWAALTVFLFAGVRALSNGVDLFAYGPIQRTAFASAVLQAGQEVLPQWFLPLRSGSIDALGCLQLSYAHWLLLAFGATALFFGRGRPDATGRRVVGASLLVSILLLFAVTCPIPGVTGWFWLHAPTPFYSLTNVWPMQRTIPLITLFVVFLAALAPLPAFARARRTGAVVSLLILGWTASQAWPLLEQGSHTGWDEAKTRQSFLGSNLDLTVTSYSYLGTPDWFVHGTVDPALELRLLRSDGTEVTSNYAQAQTTSREVQSGTFSLDPASPAAAGLYLPKLHLEPGRRYLLDFKFNVAPADATLQFHGPGVNRRYLLPEAGSPGAFGMLPGNRTALGIWSSLPGGEEVQVQCNAPAGAAAAGWESFARFSLREIDRSRLPIRLISQSPLRLEVDSPEEQCYVETFRQMSPNYIARVNGKDRRTEMSKDRGVMFPVPKGRSVVELRYEAPRYLHWAAATTALAWLLALAWLTSRLWKFGWRRSTAALAQEVLDRWPRQPQAVPAVPAEVRARRRLRRTALIAAVLICFLVAGLVARHASQPEPLRSGPYKLRFVIPPSLVGHREALMSTGEHGRGVIVFYVYPDPNHLQIGFDVWGTLLLGEPTPIERGQVQELVVDFSALYPPDAPRVKSLPRFAQQELRRHVRAELNGRSVVVGELETYPTKPGQIHFGGSAIGGSLADADFRGEFLGAERIPFHTPLALIDASAVMIQLDPNGVEYARREPLFSVGPGGRDGVAYILRQPGDLVTYGFAAADGTTIETTPLRVTGLTDVRCVLGPAVAGGPLLARFERKSEHIGGPVQLLVPERPVILNRGTNFSNVHDTAARFSGRALNIEVDSASTSPALQASTGAYELFVTFSSQPASQPEPLVVTGRKGAGDLAYSQCVDANHIVFGIDHWGIGGAKTDPIEIDYSAPHRVTVSLGSLYPAENDPAWAGVSAEARARCLDRMTIMLDGKVVLDAALGSHPTTRDEITVGENRIGGSTCGPDFTGQIHVMRRSGLPK